ncbi:hypothetical protein HK405_000499 [Cladochytrium tenue]|nr:hypothetical protein HK405_000499 [Cladochytrium tenue]
MITNDYKYPKFMRVFLALSFGFVVVMIDSRGSYDRGVKFEGFIKHRLGTVELQDQIEGLIYLATRTDPETSSQLPGSVSNPRPGHIRGTDLPPWSIPTAWDEVLRDFHSGTLPGFIDPTNVSVTGWSYGGYLSLNALAQFPHVFRVAIAGAPVTSWEMYDTAYTERYMGLLEENPDGYRRGSVLQMVDRFPDRENRLLIVHGSIDENVHFCNTEVLVAALVRAAKPHRVQVYPGERHGLRSPDAVEHFETLMMWTLPPPGSDPKGRGEGGSEMAVPRLSTDEPAWPTNRRLSSIVADGPAALAKLFRRQSCILEDREEHPVPRSVEELPSTPTPFSWYRTISSSRGLASRRASVAGGRWTRPSVMTISNADSVSAEAPAPNSTPQTATERAGLLGSMRESRGSFPLGGHLSPPADPAAQHHPSDPASPAASISVDDGIEPHACPVCFESGVRLRVIGPCARKSVL